MAKPIFTELEIYRLAEHVADDIWEMAAAWGPLARDTVGKQIIRAADSIGANIAEGAGRGSYADNRRFVKMARASLNETHHFLRRAYSRKLITADQVNRLKPLLDEPGPRLNAYLKSIGKERKPGHATDNGPLTKCDVLSSPVSA